MRRLIVNEQSLARVVTQRTRDFLVPLKPARIRFATHELPPRRLRGTSPRPTAPEQRPHLQHLQVLQAALLEVGEIVEDDLLS